MSIKYSTIEKVVKRSYCYDSIDLHHVPESLKTTLHCVLTQLSKKHERNICSPQVGDAAMKMYTAVCTADKCLHADELRISQYPLDEDNPGGSRVIYVYMPEEIKSTFGTEINYMGEYTIICFLPKDIIKHPDMYKTLYGMIDSMSKCISIRSFVPHDYISKFANMTLLLSIMDLDKNESKKEEVFDYLRMRTPGILKELQKDPKEFIEEIFKETKHYSVEELLDKAYLLAIL